MPQLLKRARDFRLPALAITDHGNLFGCIEFYELAYNNGIKPIIGCELGVGSSEDIQTKAASSSDAANHLVLLARNQRGYQNLLQLITFAHDRGWQQRPRISRKQLQDHHQGLVILSGCLRGEIPRLLFREEEMGAKTRAAEYLEIFGREYFFIEIQPPLTDAHRRLNEKLFTLAQQLDLQVVATANSHTLDSTESDLLKVLAAIRQGVTIDEVAPHPDHGFLSPEEMKAEFAHLPEAITATMTIAERCNVDLELGRIHLPRFPVEKGQDSMAILRQQAKEGLKERLATGRHDRKVEYDQRLDRELNVINRLGLADYFLVIADFVKFARTMGIPVGPGSGSAGSSLTAYALQITEIDPLQFDLLFERLINSLSPEFPDIDLGFGMEMREEVHQYLRSKYGQERVAQIVSLVTMQFRTAIRDLGKVMGLPPSDLESFTVRVGGDQRDGKRSVAVSDLLDQTQVEAKSKVSELAVFLEGLPRQVSTHATGLVIGDGPLVQRVPLYRGPKDEWVSQYNMHALKRIGLVKFDLIARKTLTVIRKGLNLIDADTDLQTALEELPLADDSAFDLLCGGKVAGIPYLENERARDLLFKWQPRQWQDLMVLLALIRPAMLESGLTEKLLQARQEGQHEKPLEYSLDQGEAAGTGWFLFDVDLAQSIAQSTGWSLEKADQLCRLLIQAEGERAENLYVEFIEAVEGRGNSREAAESVWGELEYSAGLTADKSRTVAQALTVLQAAYLKARFPEHYMAALLSSELRQHDLLITHLEDCQTEGLVLLPPDINRSEVEFAVEKEGIRFALAAIRQVSQATAAAIVQTRRERGPFHSLLELCGSVDREQLSKRALAALVKAGALDSFHCARQQLLEMLPEVLERVRLGQIALFDHCEPEIHSSLDSAAANTWEESTKLAQEKEALGFYLSGHPLSKFRYLLEKLAQGGTARLSHFPPGSQGRLGGVVERVKLVSSRKQEPLRFLRVEDLDGSMEVVVFSDVYAKCERCIEKDALILVTGRVAREGGQVRLVADDIVPLAEGAERLATSVHLHLTVEGLSSQSLRELRQLIRSQPGSCPVYLHLHMGQQAEVVQRLATNCAVRPTGELTAKLTQQFGEKCLDIRYGEGEEEQ